MDPYEDFRVTGETFAERIGEPDEFDAALGRIVQGFSYLEDSVRNVICLLLGADLSVGKIVTAEASFRQKLDLLGSLVLKRIDSVDTQPRAECEVDFRQLLAICRRSEELRNQHLHSRYSRSARAKTTAKAGRGLRTTVQPTNSDVLLDVADFVVNAAMLVEEFPLRLGIADTVGGVGDYVEYSLDDRSVAVFRFGE